jgi:hypothetical protein
MVVISVKKPDGDGFLYNTTTDTPNEVLVAELVSIWNARLQVRILAPALRELGKYGPMKKVEEQVRDAAYISRPRFTPPPTVK